MVDFVGRRQELATLERELRKVAAGVGGERPGRCVMLRGRRRVGKSRLVERFAERSGAPFLFYAATGASAETDLARLARDAEASTLPMAQLVVAARPETWDAAFDVLAAALPADRASVVVIDEVPYLMDADGAFEGMLQRAWDRVLETKPVLLVLIGSDLSMMEALNSYGRPFHQRGREMVLGPLTPAEVGHMLGLDPAEAFDAALITGGLPLICAEWPHGAGLWDFLRFRLSWCRLNVRWRPNSLHCPRPGRYLRPSEVASGHFPISPVQLVELRPRRCSERWSCSRTSGSSLRNCPYRCAHRRIAAIG